MYMLLGAFVFPLFLFAIVFVLHVLMFVYSVLVNRQYKPLDK